MRSPSTLSLVAGNRLQLPWINDRTLRPRKQTPEFLTPAPRSGWFFCARPAFDSGRWLFFALVSSFARLSDDHSTYLMLSLAIDRCSAR
jgi:hypothetical protein